MNVKTFLTLLVCLLATLTHAIPRTVPDLSDRIPENSRRFNLRIVGGNPADIKDFPHMLALYDLSVGGYICGASIISDRWALSAAHCLYFKVPAYLINLRGGSTNHASGTIFYTESYTLHPKYNHALKEFDIAILKTTATSILRGTNIQEIGISPVCTTPCCQTCPPEQAITTGWGANAEGSYPSNLFQITLPIVDRQRCSDAWGGINNMFFCIYNAVGKDSCVGDSGSPVIRNIGNQRVQIGVVSFGSTLCGDGFRPSVSTRIEMPEIRDWIYRLSGI